MCVVTMSPILRAAESPLLNGFVPLCPCIDLQLVACDVCSAYGKKRMYFYTRVGRGELHHSESTLASSSLLGVFVPVCMFE